MTFKVVKEYRGVSITPCPYCKAELRHSKRRDRRGPVKLFSDGKFYCFKCLEYGTIEAMCEEHGFDINKIPEIGEDIAEFLPQNVALSFWGRLENINAEGEVGQYLTKRAIPEGYEPYARQLPEDLNTWAENDMLRGWKRPKRFLIFPLYYRDNIVNFIGRSIKATTIIKSQSLAGVRRAQSVLLSDKAYRLPRRQIIVAEGEMDYLACAALTSRENTTVIGVGSGSIASWWTDAICASSSVLIATDLDEAGDEYAREITSKLQHTKEIRRWNPTK